MNKGVFFNLLKVDGLFANGLTQAQVDGVNLILAEAARRKTPTNYLSYAYATVFRETATRMEPVLETRQAGEAHNPTVDQAIARLESSWSRGKLPWVKTPYWRKDKNGKSWLGRSYVQLTHLDNYIKMSKITGIDLVANPDLAMRPDVALKILFDGMMLGSFTGGKFASYIDDIDESDAIDRIEYRNARKIINGTESADLVAGYAILFERALRNSGYDDGAGIVIGHEPLPSPIPAPVPSPLPTPDPVPATPVPQPTPAPEETGGFWGAVMRLLAAMFGRK